LKYLLNLISIVLIISCSHSDDAKGSDLIKHVSNKYEIVTIVKIDGIAWFSRMREGVFKFAEETGMNCSFRGPTEANKELQVELINKAIEDEVDAICIVPYDIESVESSLKKARDKGIVVVAHEASNLVNADLIIEPFNNAAYGAHLMDHLAGFMEEKGEYLVFVASYGSITHMQWQTAAVKRQQEKYPEMAVYGEWIECLEEQSIVYSEVIDAFRENPGIRGILGAPMPTAVGAGTAVNILGLSDQVSVVSTSLVSVSSQQLLDNSVDLISFWDPFDAGYVMNLLAVMVLENMEISDGSDLHTKGYNVLRMDSEKNNLFYGSSWTDVTKENMSDYAF
jgi:simple sugar transport system substrate-binding protein